MIRSAAREGGRFGWRASAPVGHECRDIEKPWQSWRVFIPRCGRAVLRPAFRTRDTTKGTGFGWCLFFVSHGWATTLIQGNNALLPVSGHHAMPLERCRDFLKSAGPVTDKTDKTGFCQFWQ